MKKLSKLKLKDFAIMEDGEMKNIVGGYGGYSGRSVCFDGFKCTNDPTLLDQSKHWCCNCSWAYSNCNDKID